MKELPVSFQFKGKQYNGILSPVHGGGAHVYHLMINKFYYGRLRYVKNEWVFDTNDESKGWESLADLFGDAIEKNWPR